MYTRCPKCGHAPLPQDQASPAACPACGIILAKFAARATAAVAGAQGGAEPAGMPGATTASHCAAPDVQAEERGWIGSLWDLFTYVPNEVSNIYWYGRCFALAVVAVWSIFIFKGTSVAAGDFGSGFVHRVLLVFHEAGHVIFMLFGRFITILGGTLGQLLMPLIVAGSLLIQRRDPFGASLFAWLLGLSVVDMAIYMYDAFDPHLILLGGGTGQESDGHDWQNMFGDLGLIRKARGIGLFFGALGWVMAAAALAWSAWILWRQHANLSDSPMAEEN